MAEKVVVTGGAGFIGSHIADEMLARGYQVAIIDNLSSGKKENIAAILDKVEFVEGSILDDALLKRLFAGAKYVFHLAAVPSVPKSVRDPLTSHEANATGTLKVLLAARDAGVSRVVYSASSSYYGDTPTLPKREDMPSNPLSPYALQKYSGEAYCALFSNLYGLETVSLRYFNIFGPRQDPASEYSAVIPKFIRALKAGKAPTVFGDGSASRDFTFVSDAVAANVLAATVSGVSGQVFNCAGGKQITINQLIETLQRLMGTTIAPKYESERPGDILHSYADLSRAKAGLGYEPQISFEDGLSRTIPAIQ